MQSNAAGGREPPLSREVVLTHVDVGTFSPPVVLEVARSLGYLEAVGLAVSEHPASSSPGQFRQLAEGSLQVALTSPDNVLAYRFNPGNPLGKLLDARVVGAVDRALGLGLYVRPGLTAADLRGARVGVDVPQSGFALALYALADGLGVPPGEYELVGLGSTPQRLAALLAGDCDATMLNAGNELLAEAAGCELLAAAGDHLSPYLGTVVAVVGDEHLATARLLVDALTRVADEVLGGRLDDAVTEAARRRLGLTEDQAGRYLARLRSPTEGLVPGGVVDHRALETLVGLRRTHLPVVVRGRDVMDGALAEGSGLVDVR